MGQSGEKCCSGESSAEDQKKAGVNKKQVLQERKHAKSQQSGYVHGDKLPKSFFIAFNEACSEDTTFQCSVIFTTYRKQSHTFLIDETANLVVKDLYNAGIRITSTCKLNTQSNEFYALIHKRDTKIKLDETHIQKYKVVMNKNKKQFDIKFMKEIGTIFKGQGVNSEGLAVIESDSKNDEYKGFLIVNDVYCKPEKNSNLYYVNNKLECKILHSLNDKGVAELNDICPMNLFGKNGYLILPQSLNLGFVGDDGNNWSIFEKWMVSNEGDASMFFVDKKHILNAIDSSDNDYKSDIIFEKIPVYLEDNFDSNHSIFKKFGKKEETGFVVEGFEGLSIDNNNNIVIILEYSNNNQNDTFNYIMTARFAQSKQNNGQLEIYIDPCKYSQKIKNNGGGNNLAQEAIIYCNYD